VKPADPAPRPTFQSLPILIAPDPVVDPAGVDDSAADSITDPFRRELARLYAELDAEIAGHAPRCDVSGRCCRFEEYGHTLFLSRSEAEWLFEPGLPAGTELNRAGCPWQVEGKCTARERRPIGCRVYFCDPAFEDRMGPISERYLARLKELHGAFKRPWDYRPLYRFDELAHRPEDVGQGGAGETFGASGRSGPEPIDLT
jgi:hypothetical protein